MASVVVVLVFILLILFASQVVVGFFKRTSTRLLIEYNELDAIQELKQSFGKLQISTSSYAVFGNSDGEAYFKSLVDEAKENLELCNRVVTESHGQFILHEFDDLINRVDEMASRMFLLDPSGDNEKIKSLLYNISQEISKAIDDVDVLLGETELEINEYVNFNSSVINHSRITFLILGIIVVLVIIIGGLLFIRSLTRPIKELVSTTRKISLGDRTAKVQLNTEDEFYTLGESFNEMVDTLDKTTVSREYLNNILKNMFDALVVTDNRLKIRSVNQAALDLLEYKSSELTGKNVMMLFNHNKRPGPPEDYQDNPEDDHDDKVSNTRAIINVEKFFKSKSGTIIPVLLSCGILKNQANEADGLIIVSHDLTEKKAIEEKLEQSRKERLIDINDAHEEERIRIATDLHDGLGQMLTAISYSVQNLYQEKPAEDPVITNAVSNIQAQIDNTIREAKNLAHNLTPIVLKDFGLIAAVENLVARANEMHETSFKFNAFNFNDRINPKLEKAIYRICQESLNNIVKHAQAKHAIYQIFRHDNAIVLVIEDDGVGFDAGAWKKNEKSSSIGLISIRERVLSFDGNFTINAEIGHGTELIIEIPC